MPDEILRQALDLLIQRDHELFEFDVNERSLTHKLAEYLQPLFPDWYVDCEYNREGHEDTKSLDLPVEGTTTEDTEARTVFPDIIVHRRGIPDNLLVIEVKKSTNPNRKRDFQKLEAFKNQLGYRHAAFVELIVGDQPNYNITWKWKEDVRFYSSDLRTPIPKHPSDQARTLKRLLADRSKHIAKSQD